MDWGLGGCKCVVWLAVVVVVIVKIICEMAESGMDEVVRSCFVGGAGNGLPSLLLLPCCHGPACLCRRRTPPSHHYASVT